MPQMSELRSEIQEAKKLHLSWQTKLIIFVVGAPSTFLFALYGQLQLALPLMITIGVLGLVILFKRKLWHYGWFWAAMAIIAALHLPLILFVPWTVMWVPALAISVVASVDFCLILWILLVVEKLMRGTEASER
jgi:hypothetical protein